MPKPLPHHSMQEVLGKLAYERYGQTMRLGQVPWALLTDQQRAAWRSAAWGVYLMAFSEGFNEGALSAENGRGVVRG